ncbi:porin family protein [Algibacter sp. R77976]|uniref:porin family protein n=1 Tax=Algibacter sp. R77976 TaxID=3093873 RepID=UPI0037C59C06
MKINAFFLLLLLNSSIFFAQNYNKTVFGVKGGLNLSYVLGSELDGELTGYSGWEQYVSLFSDTELNKKWNLENELLFSYTDDYHFLEIPLHLKYKFVKKWAVFLGPKLDFILDNDNDAFESQNYRFKNFGVSVELGAQYNINKTFFIEIRFSNGLTEQIEDLVLEVLKGKRNTLRIGLGVRF